MWERVDIGERLGREAIHSAWFSNAIVCAASFNDPS